jgi:hypothetical protein
MFLITDAIVLSHQDFEDSGLDRKRRRKLLKEFITWVRCVLPTIEVRSPGYNSEYLC